MRLPKRKIWRAFPELDRFSDAECERFVLRAAQKYRWSKARAMAITAGVLAFVIPLGLVLARAAWGIASPWTSSKLPRLHRVLDGPDARGLAIVAVVAVVAFTFLLVRDRWLIRTINQRLRQTVCSGCGYSLLGLTSDRGVVECPECRQPFFLNDAGLTDDDLMSR